jgi:predicted RNA binding protein YcfA (HicA-like mRNA interferase family)
MSKNKDPMNMNKGKEFINEACKKGAYVDRVNGGHYVLKGSKPGSCTVSYHDNNIPIKTRKSIINQLAKIGVVLGILFGLYFYFSVMC